MTPSALHLTPPPETCANWKSPARSAPIIATNPPSPTPLRLEPLPLLPEHLSYLQLPNSCTNYYAAAAQEAGERASDGPTSSYLERLVEGEVSQRRLALTITRRRLKEARFPVLKTLEHSSAGTGPKKSTAPSCENLFRLNLSRDKANVISWAPSAWAKPTWRPRWVAPPAWTDTSVLSANAINVINELSATQKTGRLRSRLEEYLAPAALDLRRESATCPVDQHGADRPSADPGQRYERGFDRARPPTKTFKQWPSTSSATTAPSPPPSGPSPHAETILLRDQFSHEEQIKKRRPSPPPIRRRPLL